MSLKAGLPLLGGCAMSANASSGAVPSHDGHGPLLSGRHKQVAKLVAMGYSNRDIATELNLSEQIVKNIVHLLFDKFGVWNRVELANRMMVDQSDEERRQAQKRIEVQRLAELRRLKILDSMAESIFDELTVLAVKIFDVPIALIVLVDSGRVWFKSNVGLEASECPREITICHYTIQQSHVLVVGNAVEDERFSCSPLITDGPKVRFYAAAPILTDDGYALGVVCVVDRKPRQFTEAQLTTLESLARLALQQMELRRELLETQNQEKRTQDLNKSPDVKRSRD